MRPISLLRGAAAVVPMVVVLAPQMVVSALDIEPVPIEVEYEVAEFGGDGRAIRVHVEGQYRGAATVQVFGGGGAELLREHSFEVGSRTIEMLRQAASDPELTGFVDLVAIGGCAVGRSTTLRMGTWEGETVSIVVHSCVPGALAATEVIGAAIDPLLGDLFVEIALVAP